MDEFLPSKFRIVYYHAHNTTLHDFVYPSIGLGPMPERLMFSHLHNLGQVAQHPERAGPRNATITPPFNGTKSVDEENEGKGCPDGPQNEHFLSAGIGGAEMLKVDLRKPFSLSFLFAK